MIRLASQSRPERFIDLLKGWPCLKKQQQKALLHNCKVRFSMNILRYRHNFYISFTCYNMFSILQFFFDHSGIIKDQILKKRLLSRARILRKLGNCKNNQLRICMFSKNLTLFDLLSDLLSSMNDDDPIVSTFATKNQDTKMKKNIKK
jgi:hypothetical protein